MTLSGMPSPVPLTDNSRINFISPPHLTDGSADLPITVEHFESATTSEISAAMLMNWVTLVVQRC